MNLRFVTATCPLPALNGSTLGSPKSSCRVKLGLQQLGQEPTFSCVFQPANEDYLCFPVASWPDANHNDQVEFFKVA